LLPWLRKFSDDVIFERILNTPAGEGFSQDVAAAPEDQSSFAVNFATSIISTSAEVPPVTTPDSMPDPLSLDDSHTLSSHIPLPILPPPATSFDDHNKQLAGDVALHYNAPLPNLSVPLLPVIAPLSAPYYPSRESFRLDPADYSDLVMEGTEKSVREAMTRMRFGFFNDEWSQLTVARQFTTQQIEEIDHMTLSDLCRIAIRILFKASALEKYVYAGVRPAI
jgi:hypothetical protein